MEECIICFEETNNFVIFNCNHKVCINCYPKINQCPMCRNTIEIQQIENQIKKLTINDKCCITILVSFVIIMLCVLFRQFYI
jgi:hypothetical protein